MICWGAATRAHLVVSRSAAKALNDSSTRRLGHFRRKPLPLNLSIAAQTLRLRRCSEKAEFVLPEMVFVTLSLFCIISGQF